MFNKKKYVYEKGLGATVDIFTYAGRASETAVSVHPRSPDIILLLGVWSRVSESLECTRPGKLVYIVVRWTTSRSWPQRGRPPQDFWAVFLGWGVGRFIAAPPGEVEGYLGVESVHGGHSVQSKTTKRKAISSFLLQM